MSQLWFDSHQRETDQIDQRIQPQFLSICNVAGCKDDDRFDRERQGV